MRIAVALTTLLLGSSVSVSAFRSARLAAENNSPTVLAAAKDDQLANRVQDRRITLDEVVSGRKESQLDAGVRDTILAGGRTIVHISKPTLNSEPLNNLFGSGFFYNGSQCYIVTARHNVNRGSFRQTPRGNLTFISDVEHNPKGAKVEVRANFAPGVAAAKLSGIVISVGSFMEGVYGDRAVIRLDRPYNIPGTLHSISVDPGNAVSELIKAGFAGDMRGHPENPRLSIDADCRTGVADKQKWFSSTCLVTPGDSGGIAVDKQKKAIIGMWITTSDTDIKTGQATVGNGHFLLISKFEKSVLADIQEDQQLTENTCRDTPEFLKRIK